MQFREIRKNTTREEHIDSEYIYIYTFVTRRLPLGKIVEKVRSEESVERDEIEGRKKEKRFHRGGKSLPTSTLLTLEPMLSVQKAKIPKYRREYRKGGIVGVTKLRSRNSRDVVLTNFLWSIGQKWPPYSDWSDGQSVLIVGATRLMNETVV